MPVDWDHRYSSTGKYVYGKDPNACVVEAISNKWLPGQGRVLLIRRRRGPQRRLFSIEGFRVRRQRSVSKSAGEGGEARYC